MADTQPDNLENEANFAKISISDLQKKYSIGRDPLYARMRYLQIKTWKISGKAYLDAEQVAHMDALHEHIKATGRMEGYLVPEPSGPVETENEQPTPTTTLTVAETQQIAAPNYAPTQKRYSAGVASPTQSSQQVDDVAAIVQSAQGKAAGTLDLSTKDKKLTVKALNEL
ncbi:MAG: hypothetical protein AB3A66_27945 (plasmid) [Nodularia sp. CChRGM 3473]